MRGNNNKKMVQMKLSNTEWDYLTGNEREAELQAIVSTETRSKKAGEEANEPTP
jgi:threonyl-tRNA synthetase